MESETTIKWESVPDDKKAQHLELLTKFYSSNIICSRADGQVSASFLLSVIVVAIILTSRVFQPRLDVTTFIVGLTVLGMTVLNVLTRYEKQLISFRAEADYKKFVSELTKNYSS